MVDGRNLMVCPKCGNVIFYNSYFKTFLCDCGYYKENKIEENIDQPWADEEVIDEMILKTLK